MTSTLQKTQREAKIDGQIKNCAGKQFATPPPTNSLNGMCFNSFHCLQSSNGSLLSPKISKYRKSQIAHSGYRLFTVVVCTHQIPSDSDHYPCHSAHIIICSSEPHVRPTYNGVNKRRKNQMLKGLESPSVP